MKIYYCFYPIIFIIIIFTASCTSSGKSAYEYNNAISNEEITATESVYKFKAAIENQNYKQLEQIKEEGISKLTKCIENIKNLENYKGSSKYKNAALHLFEIYTEIFENEFTEIINLYKQNNKLISNEINLKILKINKQTDKKIEDAINILKKCQIEFAEENNLLISKGE